MRVPVLSLSLCLALVGCGVAVEPELPDAGPDAGADARRDAAIDRAVLIDAGVLRDAQVPWDSTPRDGPPECATDRDCLLARYNREDPNAEWRCCWGTCESVNNCSQPLLNMGPNCSETPCDYRQGMLCCSRWGREDRCVPRGEGLCAGQR